MSPRRWRPRPGCSGMYGASVASAGLGYDLTDAANAVPFTRIV